METKMIRVPFEAELAKKIQNKECEGRIVTRDGRSARIICWDRKYCDNYHIISLVKSDKNELLYNLNSKGFEFCGKETINDLLIELPEYMTFKDGDVIVCDKIVLLFSGDVNQYDLCGCYCSLFGDTESLDLNFDYKGVFPETRLGTESEKQKLIDALKTSKEPKAKEYLKRFFGIEEKKEFEFKPFNKVLVRDDNNEKWRIDLFSHQRDNVLYVGIEYSWKYCIPYNEQTAHLLGTSKNYE